MEGSHRGSGTNTTKMSNFSVMLPFVPNMIFVLFWFFNHDFSDQVPLQILVKKCTLKLNRLACTVNETMLVTYFIPILQSVNTYIDVFHNLGNWSINVPLLDAKNKTTTTTKIPSICTTCSYFCVSSFQNTDALKSPWPSRSSGRPAILAHVNY